MLKTKQKILASLVLAVPLLLNTGIATTVHASSSKNNVSSITYKYTYSSGNFYTKLDNLVTTKTITKVQKTTILNLYYNNKITTRTNFKTQLDVLVKSGAITKSQQYSILNSFTSWGSDWKIPAPSTGTNHNYNSSNKIVK